MRGVESELVGYPSFLAVLPSLQTKSLLVKPRQIFGRRKTARSCDRDDLHVSLGHHSPSAVEAHIRIILHRRKTSVSFEQPFHISEGKTDALSD